MEKRHVLYLRPVHEDISTLRALEPAGWEAHPVSRLDHARELVVRHGIKVGLALLDDRTAFSLFEGLQTEPNGTDHLEWIALLNPASLERHDLCRMISTNLFDFHTLPLDCTRLATILGHAWGMAELRQTLGPANDRAHSPGKKEDEMVGTSPVMLKVFQTIRKFASVDAPVLITGESGTGKELAAKAIHERSSRSGGPFVAVNCAALPPTLIHAELFGHEKGAFTGAVQSKMGRIESANRGTIFLDEIGDLPLDLQVSLLRFLQEKTIERLGGKKSITVDARVISATNVNLQQALKAATLREDLYYRLNVLHLEMPALRDRGEDIELLLRYLFKKFSHENNGKIEGYSKVALQVARHYEWPGNVRELINRVRRALVMGENRLIRPKDLELDRRIHSRRLVSLEEARAMAEKEAIINALGASRKNITIAARHLEVSRVTLYRMLDKHNITT